MLYRKIGICIWAIPFLISCGQGKVEKNESVEVLDNLPIEKAILEQRESFYYVDFGQYPEMDKGLPIGVFDSGTGGLTVLDAIVQYDGHQNNNKATGADGEPDFDKETFIYLADQANMPYGNYSSEGKTDLLVEHIIKDTQFLLSDKYYKEAKAKNYSQDKSPVKTLVIACNTATAYGKELIDQFIEKAGINVHVIGVIDAGARGVLQVFDQSGNGSIGVMATVGTVASKGYENTIVRIKEEQGYTGKIRIYNQGGHGIAEAVDEEPDFINRDASKPRDSYRGPSLDNPEFKIDRSLLDIYNFDFDHSKMLCDARDTDDCTVLQLNDTENYVRYHLVSLMEKIRKDPEALPLKAIVLGCTHYPYLTSDIEMVLGELYDYEKNGEFIYRDFMSEDIAIIDPAVKVAEELYAYLQENDLFNPTGDMYKSRFFISVPNTDNPKVTTDENGRFPYEYKYGRSAGEIQEYVKVVPFAPSNIPKETIDRLSGAIPATFQLIPGLNSKEKVLSHHGE
ncbi:Asp/Glu/hydantoin racemase [Echinicola soli]|uniref:Asp/Glu/hydantoin racemase n=1 Tax=Echinicola soli TaxID=2591634 RepID=A0A514CJB1_9BACT|nr:aspartate/glutamate racemase family protein [Echinicola soli]QDH79915.1 Asp/Glu/hydantoin racemase [Echinicola soli]